MKNRITQPLTAGLTVLLTLSAYAADFSAGASVIGTVSHNDNLRLTKNNKISAQKYYVGPALAFGARTENSKFDLNSTFDFNRYDENEYNSNDQRVALALLHQFENSSLSLDGNYIRNTTTTNEFLTSGRIGTRADRAEQYVISPNGAYTLNENNLLQLQGSYVTQNYENENDIGYKNTSAGLDWLHVIDDRLKLITAFSYSDYRSDDIPLLATIKYATHTKTKDLQLGIDYKFTEQAQLSARIGRSRNETTYPTKDPQNLCISILGTDCNELREPTTKYGSTAALNWQWSGERQQFSLTAKKAAQPSSNGYAVDAIQVGANWSYSVSEFDKISTAISAVRNRAIDKENTISNASLADRNYGSAILKYERALTENWSSSIEYQHSSQKYIDLDYRANSNIYLLGISYRPQKWHWAR